MDISSILGQYAHTRSTVCIPALSTSVGPATTNVTHNSRRTRGKSSLILILTFKRCLGSLLLLSEYIYHNVSDRDIATNTSMNVNRHRGLVALSPSLIYPVSKGYPGYIQDVSTMFLCTSRLPSFAPRLREMRASANQNGAGARRIPTS